MRRLSAPAARRYVVGTGRRGRAARAGPARAGDPRVQRRGVARDADARADRAARQAPDASPSAAAPQLGPRMLARYNPWAWLRGRCRSTSPARSSTPAPRSPAACARAPAPSFPPGRPDALLLGGSVFDLLAARRARRRASRWRRATASPAAALERAFHGRPLRHTEGAWRSHLARLARPGYGRRVSSGQWPCARVVLARVVLGLALVVALRAEAEQQVHQQHREPRADAHREAVPLDAVVGDEEQHEAREHEHGREPVAEPDHGQTAVTTPAATIAIRSTASAAASARTQVRGRAPRARRRPARWSRAPRARRARPTAGRGCRAGRRRGSRGRRSRPSARVSDGMPSSSSMPWRNSASDWWRAAATLTSGPSA